MTRDGELIALHQDGNTMSAVDRSVLQLHGEISRAAARLITIMHGMENDISDEERSDLRSDLRHALAELESLLERGNYLRQEAGGRLVEND